MSETQEEKNYFMLMFKACYNGEYEEAKLFIRMPKILDCLNMTEDVFGRTLLMAACSRGNIKIVELLLLNEEIEIDKEDYSGNKALYFAIQEGYLEIVKCLITAGSQINRTDSDKYGNTYLHLACIMDHTEIVKTLITAGIRSINCENNEGVTPLQAAIKNDNLELVKLLLAAGAQVNQRNTSYKTGFITPLMVACINNNLEILKILIKNHADIDKTTTNGTTALIIAQRLGHTEIIDFLICERNWNRRKPLYLMRLWEDHNENKAHRPTYLGRFLMDKNDSEGQNIRRLIASFL